MTKKEFLKKAREVSWIGVDYLARWNNPKWLGMSDLHIELQLTIDKVKREIQAWKEGKLPADQVRRIALIHFPRNHGKTSQLLFRILWELGNFPDHRIKIVCESTDNAQKRVVFLQQHILNNKHLHELFPHLRPADQGMWNKNQFYVERNIISVDPSVEGCGILTATTGGRATIIFCYDRFTQVLTKSGWKYGIDLKAGEEILAYDPEKKICKWEVPTNIVKYDYKGPLYVWKGIGLYVTENHKLFNYLIRDKKMEVLYTGKDHDRFERVPLWSWTGYDPDEKIPFYIPSPDGKLPEIKVGSKVFGGLLGLLIRTAYKFDENKGAIYVNKKRFVNSKERAAFAQLLKSCKFYYDYNRSGNYVIKSPHLAKFLAPYFYQMYRNYYAFIPYPLIFELPYPAVHSMWHYFTKYISEEHKNNKKGFPVINWDDFTHFSRDKSFFKVKQLMEDFLDALSCLVGKRILKKQGKAFGAEVNWDELWVSKRTYTEVGKCEVIENYKGKVWCVTVPSGGIIVRRRIKQKGVSASTPIPCGNCDDPIGMHNAITYPENKKKAEDAFFGNWMPMLEEDGFVVIAYTVWTEEDFPYKLESKPEVCHILKKVIDDDFNPVWPERWPKDALIAKYNEIGPLQFARSYQGKPASVKDYLFDKEEVLNAINPSLVLKKCYDKKYPTFVGVDLAISKKKTGKNTAIIAIQVLPDNRRRLIDIAYGQFSSVETAQIILDFIKQYKPIKVFVENNSYQQSLLEWISVIDKSGISYGVVDGYFTGAQKFDPFKGLPALSTEFFKGLWEIPVAKDGHEYDEKCGCPVCKLITEIVRFPHYKTSDLLMAMFFAREAFVKTYGETVQCRINFVDLSEEIDFNQTKLLIR